MNKSIAFVYLPHPWLRNPEAQLPLGILYLAAITRNADYDTEVYNFSGVSLEQALLDTKDHDFFAITATSLEIPMANQFGKALKTLYPKSKLLIGGPGTITPELIDRCYDLIYIGEAENEILKYLEALPKINYSITHVNQDRYPKDLDRLPLPARSLVESSLGGDIFAYGKHYTKGKSTTILSSRGCPHRCAFCAEAGMNLRLREPSWVVSEMLVINRRFNITEFRFSDDSFMTNPNRILTFCRMLDNVFGRGEISWRVSCRVQNLKPEVVMAMIDSGCKEFSLGIESFDQDVLDCLNKGTTVKQNERALNLISDLGGSARILFMIRTPGQTLDTVNKNIDALLRLPYEIIACTTFAPLPGSLIWSDPERFGIKILSRNLGDYNFYFYGVNGRYPIKRLFEYLHQDTEKIEEDSERFRTFLEKSGSLNKG